VSEIPEGIISFSIDDAKINSGAASIENKIKGIDKTVQNTSNSLADLDKKQLDIIKNGIKLEEKQRALNKTFANSVTTLAGTAAGVTALAFTYGDLDKKQLAVRKSQAQVEEKQQKLNKLIADGKKGTQDYEDAIRDLGIAQDQLKSKTDDIFQSQVAFGLQVVSVATQIPQAVKALEGLSASTKVLTAVTWLQNLSLWANPLFLPASAAAIAMTIGLVATNQFGLRDAMFGTTKAIDQNTIAAKGIPPAYGQVETSANSAGSAVESFGNKVSTTTGQLAEASKQTIDLWKAAQNPLAPESKAVDISGRRELEEIEGDINDKKQLRNDLEHWYGIALTKEHDTVKAMGMAHRAMVSVLEEQNDGTERGNRIYQERLQILKQIETAVRKISEAEKKNELELGPGKDGKQSAEEQRKKDEEAIAQEKRNNQIRTESIVKWARQISETATLSQISALIEMAGQEYQNGNIPGAKAIEKEINNLGNSPTVSGKLRSVINQMKLNSDKISGIAFRTANLGGFNMVQGQMVERTFGTTSTLSRFTQEASKRTDPSRSQGRSLTASKGTRHRNRNKNRGSAMTIDSQSAQGKRLMTPELEQAILLAGNTYKSFQMGKIGNRNGNKFSKKQWFQGQLDNFMMNMNNENSKALARLRNAVEWGIDFESMSAGMVDAALQKKYSLVKEIVDKTGLSQSQAKQLVKNNDESEIADIISALNNSKSVDVQTQVKIVGTNQGRNDLANMETLKRRMLAASGVVI
jgi:hypothetical protein